MIMGKLGDDNFIRINEATHQYFDPKGEEYRSVTRLLRLVQVPFDQQFISKMMAKHSLEPGATDDQIVQYQQKILTEWEEKRDSAANRGNIIHENLEMFSRKGKCEVAELEPLAKKITMKLSDYYRIFDETVVYSTRYKVAGRFDRGGQRQKGANSLYDFYDFKTNESKGIRFDSRSKDRDKHYNRFLLPPLDHLEDCNYNIYSLQLSLYARLASLTYGIRIGKLGIIFVDNNLNARFLPVPYMKYEVEKLLDHYQEVCKAPWNIDGGTNMIVEQTQETQHASNDEEW